MSEFKVDVIYISDLCTLLIDIARTRMSLDIEYHRAREKCLAIELESFSLALWIAHSLFVQQKLFLPMRRELPPSWATLENILMGKHIYVKIYIILKTIFKMLFISYL